MVTSQNARLDAASSGATTIASQRGKLALAITMVLVVGFLLFFRLGHYSLWDDEAMTALGAKGVLKSGDTTAVLDNNIVAYRYGSLLYNLHDRSSPPLPSYVAAASLALFGESSLAARLPFALCGLLWVILFARWLWKENITVTEWILFLMGCVGNVSLILFSRQCRYYSIAILCSTAIVYLYVNWTGRRREMLWMIVLSVVLFASNYMNYFALYACLLIDYLIWGRKRHVFTVKEWSALLIPQIICAAILLSVWNPLRTGNSAGLLHAVKSLKVWLMCISFFDMNACEFGAGIFLLLSPLIGLFLRDSWLLRASFAFVAYVVVMSIVSPQIMDPGTAHSDIRYLAPLIPLCIFIGVRSVLVITRRIVWLAIPLAVFVLGTNLFEGITLRPFAFQSTLVRYIGELAHPPPDPYTPTAEWIRQNIPAKASVWVLPPEMTYPLMFHAPQPVYCWQLSFPPAEAFKNLDPIHFMGQVAPDYVVVFGPQFKFMKEKLGPVAPVDSYERVAMLDVYWRDSFRPELYWRRFEPRTKYNRENEAIYVLKRVPKAQSSHEPEAKKPETKGS